MHKIQNCLLNLFAAKMAFVFENLTPWKMSLWNRPRMATIWEEEPEPEDDYYSEAPETLDRSYTNVNQNHAGGRIKILANP